MISRRPYARHNRGRVAAITPAPSATIQIPLAGTWSAYYDADYGITIDTGVSAWASQDGAIDAEQANGASQPALITDWLGTGRNALDFDGTSHYLRFDAFAALVTGDVSFGIAMHFSLDTIGATRDLWSLGLASSPSNFRRATSSASNALDIQTNHDGSIDSDASSNNVFAANTEYVLTVSYDSVGHTIRAELNGTEILNTAHSGAPNVDVAAIGALLRSTLLVRFDGKCRRFAARTSVFSSGDVTALQGWLGT